MNLLFTARGEAALAAAAAQPDPGSLVAASALRTEFPADLAAAALAQEALRRKAVGKFGDRARELYLTRDGLEQASRSNVAAWRAVRFAHHGWTHVVDLGCGIGADARALVDAGLEVTAVEIDPDTAEFARANLPGSTVLTADATTLDVPAGSAVFLDPARRTARGRTWDLAQITPSWEFVLGRLSAHPGCAKLGPGLDRSVLPETMLAEWVSDGGDVVECGLWSQTGETGFAATHLPSGDRLVSDGTPLPQISGIRSHVLEPDGAALRALCLGQLAATCSATRLHSDVAYLTADAPAAGPWLTSFEVLDVLPYKEKVLRAWVAENGIGTVEIKKRGIDVDPAELRRRLKPRGPGVATLILTPTLDGARAIVSRRTQTG